MGVSYLDNHSGKKALSDRFTQIYNQYKSSIYKFCLVKLNGDSELAEDCMQNTFMTFYQKLKNDEEITNPRAYLYKIANNFVLKSIEKTARHNKKTVPIDDCKEKVIDERDNVDSNLDYQLLIERLKNILSEEEILLLNYKYIYDLTVEQTASQLGITKQAVAKRLQRLREKIKHSIDIE
jgi:RNA polymerase sigma-70 factor (ECF subfamily)